MKHILYLPSWFPDRNDPYSGDFILRYAEAASRYNRITIFFTAVDDKIRKPEITEEKINENLSVYISYYPAKTGKLSSAINGLKRFFALRKLYEKVFHDIPPDLVHVHVAYPAGLFALYLKKRKGLDYIISEQHTIYMLGYENYRVRRPLERRMVSVVYSNAKKIHTVSKSLGDALINLRLATNEPIVIPNVVNTDMFTYGEKSRSTTFCFIHVSLLVDQKNPEGMLAALSLVKKNERRFCFKDYRTAKGET